MRIGVFFPKDNEEHRLTLAAFAAGFDALGHDDVFLTSVDNYEDCDIAVVFGVYKKAVPASNARGAIIEHHRKNNKPVIVLEKGYVKRDEYYAAGFNGLNGRADFKNRNSPMDRWLDLDIELTSWRDRPGEYILLAGQVPWDASVQHIDYINWLPRIVQDIRKYSAREIRFRPHPLAINATPSIFGTKRSTRPLSDDLAGAHAVVTFNSNTSVDAVLAGIPVFVFDDGAMTRAVANPSLKLINSPLRPDRSQWVSDLAYTQWTLREMEQGLPHKHLFNVRRRTDNRHIA